MRKITVTPDFHAQLNDGGYPAEVCNAAGERVAVVLPPEFFREMFDIYCEKVFGPPVAVTPEDVADGVTTEEAIAYLRALEAELRGAA